MSVDLRQSLEALVATLVRLSESSPELRSQLVSAARAIVTTLGPATEAGDLGKSAFGLDGDDRSGGRPEPLDGQSRAIWSGYAGTAYGGGLVGRAAAGAGPGVAPALGSDPWRATTAGPGGDDLWGDGPVKVRLTTIAERLRLKADATQWARERAQLVASGADYVTAIEPQDNEFHHRAQALGREHGEPIYLWVLDANAPTPHRPSQFEELAGSYQAASEAYDLLSQLFPHRESARELFQRAMELAAEAQNAIRSAASELDWEDRDQSEAFGWLKQATRIERIYIARYMRAQDAADPSRYRDLLERIAHLRQSSVTNPDTSRRVGGLLDAMASAAAELPSSEEPQGWERLFEIVELLVREGVPVNDPNFARTLLPLIGQIPPIRRIGPAALAVLRGLDNHLAANPADEPSCDEDASSGPIGEARDLLEGRSLVIVGDNRRPGVEDAIRRTLGLRAVHWITATGDPALADLEGYVNRRDVAGVLFATLFSTRNVSDIQEICDQYDRPLAEIRSSYTPALIASQFLAQAREQVDADGSAAVREGVRRTS